MFCGQLKNKGVISMRGVMVNVLGKFQNQLKKRGRMVGVNLGIVRGLLSCLEIQQLLVDPALLSKNSGSSSSLLLQHPCFSRSIVRGTYYKPINNWQNLYCGKVVGQIPTQNL